jgi:hypothetical protein
LNRRPWPVFCSLGPNGRHRHTSGQQQPSSTASACCVRLITTTRHVRACVDLDTTSLDTTTAIRTETRSAARVGWARTATKVMHVLLLADVSHRHVSSFPAICRTGCHNEHGSCDRPGECRSAPLLAHFSTVFYRAGRFDSIVLSFRFIPLDALMAGRAHCVTNASRTQDASTASVKIPPGNASVTSTGAGSSVTKVRYERCH